MATYTIGELADAVGLPVRTLRYYQTAGLLPRARRAGRSMVYDDSHIQRLNNILELGEQGLKLSAIREVLEAGGTPLVALLGARPSGEGWLHEAERDFTIPELAEFLGERYFDLLGPLESAGYLERRSEPEGTVWHCPDLPLLRGALHLAEVGTDVALIARGRDLLRSRSRRLADDLVQLWLEESEGHFGGHPVTDDHLDRVRAVVWQSAAHVMAQEIDRAIRALAESQDTEG
jgi:DNA-binding transcriptional MerR regulator